VYTSEERLEQTVQTINNVRSKIPNCKVFIAECSDLSEEASRVLREKSDYFINFYNDLDCKNKIEGISKAFGEYTLIMKTIEYLLENKIDFSNLYKISGRYWLTDDFNFQLFDNELCVGRHAVTSFYKIHRNSIDIFMAFLERNIYRMIRCEGAEQIFASFMLENNRDFHVLPWIGISGNIAVDGMLCQW
jgi:hypothetical protein